MLVLVLCLGFSRCSLFSFLIFSGSWYFVVFEVLRRLYLRVVLAGPLCAAVCYFVFASRRGADFFSCSQIASVARYVLCLVDCTSISVSILTLCPHRARYPAAGLSVTLHGVM